MDKHKRPMAMFIESHWWGRGGQHPSTEFCTVAKIGPSALKGTKRQYSGSMSQIFKTVKTIEMQPVRPTEVCGKRIK